MPLRASRRAVVAVAVWAVCLALAWVGGLLLRHAGAVITYGSAPPLIGSVSLRVSVGTAVAVLMAVLVVVRGPAFARSARWGVLLLTAWVTTAAFAVALATTDGWSRLTAPLRGEHDYLVVVPQVAAVGALRPDLAPGTLVVPDQVIDATWGRDSTYYDEPGAVVHVGFADPYCPQGRAAARSDAMPVVDGGTLVVIQGPRFSTRAESRRNAAAGGDVVGMTGMPEAVLARELALCYTCLAVVTDADAGVEAAGSVSHQAVLEEFARSVGRLRTVLADVVAALPVDDACSCRHALDGLTLPFELPAGGAAARRG